MQTIDRIVKENGYTLKQLYKLEELGIANGMGGKGGFQFTDNLRKFKFFKQEKEAQLLDDMDLVSDIHDDKFHIGGGFKDYIKANYKLGTNMIQLFNWTSWFGRLIIFINIFFGTTLFGRKYFNFK